MYILNRRYVYKYVNDLEAILGYSAAQVHAMLGIEPMIKENDEKRMDEDKKICKEAKLETNLTNVPPLTYAIDSPGKLGEK